MDERQHFDDPVHYVSAALACVRRLRVHAEEVTGGSLAKEAGRHIEQMAHASWDERGIETTVILQTQEMSPEAERFAVMLPELRRLARLIEGVLDHVRAEAIVDALRGGTRSTLSCASGSGVAVLHGGHDG